MSVGSIIGGGVALVRREPKTIAVWAAIYLVFAFATAMLFRPMALDMVAFQQQVSANAAAGIKTPPPFHSQIFEIVFLLEFVAAILSVVAFAAVTRAVVRPGGDRFAYLRFGMDELRLIGLGILLLAAGIVIEIAAILMLGLVGALAGVALGKTAGVTVAVLLGFVLILGLIYLEVRISLVGAFTVLRRKIVIGPAWRATRGHFWTLFGVYALLTLAFFAFWLVVMALTNAPLLAAYIHFDPQTMNAALREQMARQGAGFSVATILPMIPSTILLVVMGAIGIGSVATAAIDYGALADADSLA